MRRVTCKRVTGDGDLRLSDTSDLEDLPDDDEDDDDDEDLVVVEDDDGDEEEDAEELEVDEERDVERDLLRESCLRLLILLAIVGL